MTARQRAGWTYIRRPAERVGRMPGSTRINPPSPLTTMALLQTHSLCRTETPEEADTSVHDPLRHVRFQASGLIAKDTPELSSVAHVRGLATA